MSTTKDATSWQKQHEKHVQDQQLVSNKIAMIKHLRALTRLLGRLGIKQCITDYQELYGKINAGRPPGFPIQRPPIPSRYGYGWGLKECKDAVENYLDRKAAAAAARLLSIGVTESKSDPVEPI